VIAAAFIQSHRRDGHVEAERDDSANVGAMP
jgi:hypothetical protein